MTEFVGISYREVVMHAFLPATISYIGLFYIVHLEAIKLNLPTLKRAVSSTVAQQIIGFTLSFFALVILSGVLYFGFGWVKSVFGPASLYIACAVFLVAYLGLLWISTRMPELELDDPDATFSELPETRPTLLAGLHFLLPVVVLIWCLMIERFSPSYAIYWAILAMTFVMVTQRPLIAFMRGRGDYAAATLQGFKELIAGLAAGARNMIGIAIALAAAGIIVGAVSLTGLGLVMVNVIEVLSGGYLLAMLFFTAVISIILGMGLPTTANYVVVASIMAPVVVTLAAQSGVVIPAIAVHMFVFYCGLMSGNTPPVAVDAYAAAALAQSDPMKTCLQAFYYGIRTILLPFIFVFNTELLLIGVEGPFHFIVVATISTIAMLLFVAATQHYFLARNKIYETALLLVLSISLLLPSLWINLFHPPYKVVDALQITEFTAEAPADSLLRVRALGENFSGDQVERLIALPLGAKGQAGDERLFKEGGLAVRTEDGKVFVEDIKPNGPAQTAGLDFDWEILTVEVPQKQPSKNWVYPPVLVIVALLMLVQRRRRKQMSETDLGSPVAGQS
jgi:TRAP transporter 4TM/12TM fusion protein